MKLRVRRYLTGLLLILLLGGLLLAVFQRFLLFPTYAIPPVPAHYRPPDGLIRVNLSVPEGTIEGWFIPGDGVSEETPGPVVFFAHGNGELVDFAAPGLVPYLRRGVSVALLEYRGYGRSAGSPSEKALVTDLVRFHDTIVRRAEVLAERVVFHGRSVGGGVIFGLSRHRTPRALISESAFRSVAVLARKFLIPRFLVYDPFDNEAAIRELDFPVLLFHGTRDELVPFEHGQILASVADDAKLVSFDCGHNDLPPSSAVYWAEIDAYLKARGVLR